MEKLHLAEIMDGSTEEFRRILNKYKNVQKFLEAMGASRAPPVPKTVIHKIRLVRKSEDTISRPIPQDVYHQLMQPQKMEVTYRSMISLAGPITWAYPKASASKKRKQHKAVAPEGDFDDEGLAEDSDSDFDERRERKQARTNKKKRKQSSINTHPPPPAIPFQFALDSTGEILYGNDGCPVINPVASPQTKYSPTKRNGKKQVTFSSELDQHVGESSYGAFGPQPEPQRLADEGMQQALEYITSQLDQQRQQRANPDAHPDFRMDPLFEDFLNEDAESGQLARQLLESDELGSQHHELASQTLADLHAAATSTEIQTIVQQQTAPSTQQSALSEPIEGSQHANTFSLNLEIEDNTFDSIVAKVQHLQNDPQDSELNAIFDVFMHCGADDGSDNRAYDGLEGGSDGQSFDISVGNVIMAPSGV